MGLLLFPLSSFHVIWKSRASVICIREPIPQGISKSDGDLFAAKESEAKTFFSQFHLVNLKITTNSQQTHRIRLPCLPDSCRSWPFRYDRFGYGNDVLRCLSIIPGELLTWMRKYPVWRCKLKDTCTTEKSPARGKWKIVTLCEHLIMQ